jgi:hypothetical protein
MKAFTKKQNWCNTQKEKLTAGYFHAIIFASA